MAVTYITVEGATAATTTTLFYTAPSTVLVSLVKWMAAVNTDTATARQLYIFKIPTAGSTNSASMVRVGPSNTIAAGKTEAWDTFIPVAPSGKIYTQSDAASVVTVHAFIVEIT